MRMRSRTPERMSGSTPRSARAAERAWHELDGHVQPDEHKARAGYRHEAHQLANCPTLDDVHPRHSCLPQRQERHDEQGQVRHLRRLVEAASEMQL